MSSATYAAWSKIAPITIANAPGVANYQVCINLTHAAEMNADFSDIRFTDTSDTALSYWLESATAGAAVVWVKVASATTEIELLFGNDEATSESSGANVFDFFDDWSGASLDTGKWTKAGTGTATLSSGALDIKTTAQSYTTLQSVSTFSPNVVIEARIKTAHAGNQTAAVEVFGSGSIYTGVYQQAQFAISGANARFWNSNSSGSGADMSPAWASGTYKILTLRRKTDGSEWYQDRANLQTLGSNYPTAAKAIWFEVYSYNGTAAEIFCDWVLVRKYQATEPSCSVGSATPNLAPQAYDDTVTATRSVAGTIIETGGEYQNKDTVTTTRYLGCYIVETGGAVDEPSIPAPPTAPATIGYSFIIDGENYTTENIINLTIRDRLNQLPRFDFRAHSLTDTDLTHITVGATVIVYYNGIARCEGFIERFDNQQSKYFWDCTGYGVGRYLDYRRSDVPTLFPVGLAGENTVKDILSHVITTSCGYPGSGEASWVVVGETGPDLLIYKIQNQKALEHVAQLVQMANLDWRCDMMFPGNILSIGDTSVTHTATTLKIERDLIRAEIVTDMSKLSNNIVIQSKDSFGNTIISSIGEYTNVCNLGSGETLLKYDVASGASRIYVFDHSDFPNAGSLYLSADTITYTGKSSPSDAYHPYFEGLTATASHATYEPVMMRDSMTLAGAVAPFLDAVAGSIKIGREQIGYTSITSIGADAAVVHGPLTRGVATTPIYAHGRGAPVFDMAYTLSSPSTTSSVGVYGRKDEVISGLGYQDMNALDLAAYGVLQTKSATPMWGQAYLVGGDFPTVFATTPRVGDWVTIENATTSTATAFRITGLDYDQMRGTITVNWGQNEEYALADLRKSSEAENMAMAGQAAAKSYAEQLLEAANPAPA